MESSLKEFFNKLRALTIFKKPKGSKALSIHHITCLHDLASLYEEQNKYDQARLLLEEALTIQERELGSEHPDIVSSLEHLALYYMNQKQYAQAEKLYQRALTIREYALGPEHPRVADTLNEIGRFYYYQDKYEQARPLLQRAITIDEKVLGKEHPETLTLRENNVRLQSKMKREEKG